MATKREVITVGNPVLRQVAMPVADVGDPQLQRLIEDLILTAREANGVGIAAPQVACSERLFIVASRPNLRYPNAPLMAPTAMLNPRLVAHGETQVAGWEGCLSVPGMRGLVPRYDRIDVAYIGQDGMAHRQELTDFVARIFQHELDHLDGIVFLDRVGGKDDLLSEQDYLDMVLAEAASRQAAGT
jgi:peptide deformylase